MIRRHYGRHRGGTWIQFAGQTRQRTQALTGDRKGNVPLLGTWANVRQARFSRKRNILWLAITEPRILNKLANPGPSKLVDHRLDRTAKTDPQPVPGHKGVEIRCAGVDTGNTAFTRLDLGADNLVSASATIPSTKIRLASCRRRGIELPAH